MVAEIYGGLSAIKSAFDIAKGLKDIHDATLRNAAIIELQEKLLSAQEAQSALTERVSDLEKQVAAFETWDRDKQKYVMAELPSGTIAYALKPEALASKPFHYICAKCNENRKRSPLQPVRTSIASQTLGIPSQLDFICFVRRHEHYSLRDIPAEQDRE
jgi:CII-binding regulator of phage lambda lysogenization HflD